MGNPRLLHRYRCLIALYALGNHSRPFPRCFFGRITGWQRNNESPKVRFWLPAGILVWHSTEICGVRLLYLAIHSGSTINNALLEKLKDKFYTTILPPVMKENHL